MEEEHVTSEPFRHSHDMQQWELDIERLQDLLMEAEQRRKEKEEFI